MIPPFTFARIPHIIFGKGKLNELFNVIPNFGKKVLIVTGGKSLKQSGRWDGIISNLEENSIDFSSIQVSNEPSPSLIDNCVSKLKNKKLDLVVSIGGGSVIDAGKAISAMLKKDFSIKNYLEGVGNKIHDGHKIPFIAIPTTSGTGSEATKNAVISEIGLNGFKKSLRHDNLVPNVAIVDPNLMLSCPTSVTAACGMDAFTQLLESYVSPKGSPITEILALDGMEFMSKYISSVNSYDALNIQARSAMAYGSLISGITLANAGLGIIHGLASSIGGLFDIPHGVVCGTLLAEATKINIKVLKKLGPSGKVGLRKYAKIGAILTGDKDKNKIDDYYIALINILTTWTKDLQIELLGKYGIKEDDIGIIVENTGLKNNPVHLSRENITNILISRI